MPYSKKNSTIAFRLFETKQGLLVQQRQMGTTKNQKLRRVLPGQVNRRSHRVGSLNVSGTQEKHRNNTHLKSST